MKSHGCAFTKETLPLFEGMLNPSVAAQDELRLSKQCLLIYRRLLKGPATNVELTKLTGSQNPTARRTDVRQELRRLGADLKLIKKMGNGVNLYGIVKDGKIIGE